MYVYYSGIGVLRCCIHTHKADVMPVPCSMNTDEVYRQFQRTNSRSVEDEAIHVVSGC